jgi:tetratricopeptide (TPR) repeat protein
MHRLLLALWLGSRLLFAAQQEDDQALAQRAVEAERRGDFPSAISGFQTLLRNGADSPELRTNLGIAYFQMRDFGRALQQFRIALATQPNSAPGNLFAGLSLLNAGHPQESLAYLQKAHRIQPEDPTPLLALARAEVACNHFAQSRAFYEEAVHLYPQNAEAWYGLGIVERVLAERTIKQSRPGMDNSDAQAKSRAALQASEQAIGKAMELDPGSVHARMILGEAFRIAERYDLAVKEYKEATEQQPRFAPAWAGLAVAYSASGDDRNALQAAAQALDLEPNDAGTNALVAGTYLRLSDYSKAEPYALRALQLQPDLSSAQIVLAKIYLSRRRPQKALPMLQAAVKEDTDGSTYYLLATTLRQLGRSADAAAAMKKYQQLHGSHVKAMSDVR